MGYYVQITDSNAYIPKDQLKICHEKMCSLNETHDSQKNGGSWSNGKQTSKWFSWMDANYPETCKDTKAIFEQMGFDTEYNSNGDLMILGYDNKMGQESLFLESIQNNVIGSISWRGEDGETWKTEFFGDKVIEAESITKKIDTKKTLRIK